MLPNVGGHDVFWHVPISEVQCEFADLKQVHLHYKATLGGDLESSSLWPCPGSLGCGGIATSTAALISDKAEESSGP